MNCSSLSFGFRSSSACSRIQAYLGFQVGRKPRVLVHHVLKIGGQVNLAGADARKRVEGLGRQRRGAVLDSATQAVVLAGDARQFLERLQIDLHVGPDRAVGVHEPAVSRARSAR